MLITLLLPPVISFPLLLLLFKRNMSNIVFPLAFLFAVWSIYCPPIGDLNRYFILIDNFDVEQFIYTADIMKYNLVTALCYLCNKFGIHLEILRAFLVFISYITFLSISVDIIKKKHQELSSATQVTSLVIMYLLIPLWSIAYGLRWGTACIFLVSGLYYFLIANKKKKGILLIIFTAGIHLAVLLPLFLLSVFYIVNIKNKLLFLILSILGIFAGEFILYNLMLLFFPDWSIIDAYMGKDAYYNNGILEDFALKNYIMKFVLLRLPLYFYTGYCFVNWDKYIQTPSRRLFVASILMLAICSMFINIQMRCIQISILLASIDFLFNLPSYRKYNSFLKIALCIVLFYFLCSYISTRKWRDYSREIYFPFVPGIISLFVHYDKDYVYSNIDETGNYWIEND